MRPSTMVSLPAFRAAVDSAFRSGQSELADRLTTLVQERFVAGAPWPAGTQLTAQGIRDMFALLIQEALDG